MTVAIPEPHPVAISERDVVDGWITVAADVGKLADYICETDFVPKTLRNKPAAIAACILTGRELGIGPMASLKSIHMVQGIPSLSAEYKRARALAAGHQIVIEESTSARCVVRGRRNGTEQWVTITWTLDHARRAKLAGKDVWQQYPQRMLQARATSELCDLLFPDATLGLETTEVLEDGGALVTAITGDTRTEKTAEQAAEPKPRTAQRKPRTPHIDQGEQGINLPPDPTAAATSAASTTPATSSTGNANQPPLPGEEDDTDYDTPGTATPDQLTALWATFTTDYAFGSDDKATARETVEKIIRRHLDGATTKDLSRNEASAAIDTLKRCGGDWAKVEALLGAGGG
jgi:hypothetical protein